jgi:hypothetical protein
MNDRRRKSEPAQFLSGWKEIANYLGKGVRTVQRYEMQLQLPVRRPAGRPWGSVVATRTELDAWVNASPIREVFRVSANNTPKDYAACADEIKRGVEKMTQLRDQMLALRMEVRESVQLLRNTVCEMQGELNQNLFEDSSLSSALLAYREKEQDFRAPKKFELLSAPEDYPKAS